MRKTVKKIIAITLGAALSAGALSLAACGSSFTPLADMPEAGAEVVSNGGFVVKKGDYVYFVNGVESPESNNTYGSPVKGALMRIKEEEIAAGNGGAAETVVPSLIVSGDYTGGTFIYGDRVYYATPNNTRNTSGVIETGYLDFKSAKLDGSDVQKHLQVSDSATVYRFVKADEKVYILYEESNNLHSYDIAAKEDTVLAKSVTGYALNSNDKEDPYFYYTMGVTKDIDTEAPISIPDYNQIYRVRADAKEAPYEYEYDADYLKEHDGEEPYLNLGEIVLDGIGELQEASVTQFNHDAETPSLTKTGYTYALQSYANGGIYFTRTEGTRSSLYYLDASLLEGEWDSVSGNSVKGAEAGSLTVVANSTHASKASSSAIFYHDGEGDDFQHHYLYVANNQIYRADVRKDGSGEIENSAKGTVEESGNQTGTIVAYDVSSATLVSREDGETYDYVYYTSGGNVYRAVYNGSGRNYDPPSLPFGDENNKPWQPVQILDVTHATGWYNFEVVDGRLYFADSRAYGSNTYNYISTVSLLDGTGKPLDNEQLEAVNEKYNSIMDSDAEKGLFAKLDADHGDLADALRYYFYTGETGQFDENIKAATDAGKKADYLYTEDDQNRFHSFAEGKGDPTDDKLFEEADYKDGETSYRTYSAFVTKLGKWSKEDKESWGEYWSTTGLKSYTAPAEEKESLPGWAIALIVIAAVLAAAGAGVGIWFYLKKRSSKEKEPKEPLMDVNTDDDKTLDVYTQAETAEPVAPAEESAEPEAPAAEEPVETPADEAPEAPAEESETPAEEEAPVETPAETEPEAPSDPDKTE